MRESSRVGSGMAGDEAEAGAATMARSRSCGVSACAQQVRATHPVRSRCVSRARRAKGCPAQSLVRASGRYLGLARNRSPGATRRQDRAPTAAAQTSDRDRWTLRNAGIRQTSGPEFAPSTLKDQCLAGCERAASRAQHPDGERGGRHAAPHHAHHSAKCRTATQVGTPSINCAFDRLVVRFVPTALRSQQPLRVGLDLSSGGPWLTGLRTTADFGSLVGSYESVTHHLEPSDQRSLTDCRARISRPGGGRRGNGPDFRRGRVPDRGRGTLAGRSDWLRSRF
jgi:hypothetical protein